MKSLGLVLALILVGCAAEEEPTTQEPEPESTAEPAPQQTAAAETPPEDCSTPYTVDDNGRKHYKIVCVQP